ncbi:extracellular solute-binding protein [Marinococcus luteus]|uniref:extracellular solute-binding protein n=1 Tax=Marinococcus luteus TaxID=1122204 RepID=UPI002ACCCC7B|nr:extracellular solute-binding protein [Marinococcus luteus]MDZ5781643.1 extracellular solute-binding protein [Marinococcus luteus]
MKKMKAVSFLAAGCATAMVMTGCNSESSGSGDGGGDGDQKTIEFMHLWPEGSSKDHYDIVNEIIADYEEQNPDTKVELEVLSNEQYKEKLQVTSTSGELPDVGMTWPGGFLEPYVDGEMFAPLDDVLDEDDLRDSYVEGTTEAYEMGGSTYGLPLELNVAQVFYNSAIFDEYNLEEPETYEELQEIISTLQENDVAPIALGNQDRWTGSLWYMYMADRLGEDNLLNQAINGEASFTEEPLVNAAEKTQNLAESGAFTEGFNGLSDQEAKSMFTSEQAAMYLIATWDLPNYTTDETVSQDFRDAVDYFDFPTVEGKGSQESLVGGPGVGLFVSEESDVKEESKDFVKYFSEEWGEKSVSDAGVIPATKVNTDNVDLPDMYLEVLEDLNNAENLTLFADVQMSPDVAETHLSAIQSLFGGEITPEEFAEMHEEAIEEEENE